MDKEPNVKDLVQDNGIPEKKIEFIKKLRARVHDDEGASEQWREKMLIAHNQRIGIKLVSTAPYEGAPDIPLPETDKLIKKAIPDLVLSVWNSQKIANVGLQQGVEETGIVKARVKRAGDALNMILRTKMDLFRKLLKAAEHMKENGFALFRIIEKYHYRRVDKVINLKD